MKPIVFLPVWIILLLVLLQPSNVTAGLSFWPYHHVHIVNELSDPKAVLLVHCKSKDDDLGVHYVTVDNEYTWRFKPDVIKETMYWCYLAYNNRHVAFEAYNKADPQREYQFHSFWNVTDEAVFQESRNEDGVTWENILPHPWKPGSR
ncbi:unnamed protein product [Linum tenue]|uniref:S-protein homolog n=1 Tax=Linum tenue TaxID=586396 RepID=A0AAV0LST8_9ROSI|nr:unnamed protein product [Linum tenue]